MGQYKNVYEGIPPFFTSQFSVDVSPRKQTLKDMICFTYCPYFSYGSFTFAWMLMCILMYTFCFWISGITKSQQLLKTSQKALFTLGEFYPYYIVRELQLYRLFTSLLLFRNFYHLLFTLITILGFNSYVEHMIGWKKCFLLVVFSGFAGPLFGSIFMKQATIEGSTPISGVFGYLIGIVFISWRKWELYTNERMHMLLILIFTVLLNAYSCLIYRNVNIFSQTGALVYGFIFSCWQNELSNQIRGAQFMKFISFALLAAIMAILVINFIIWKSHALIQ